MFKLNKHLLFSGVLLLCSIFAQAQVTSAALIGTISSDKKEALTGAVVSAVHVPSGTKYAIAADNDGNFFLANMRVGGPYKITATFVGYKDQSFDDVYLNLGQKTQFNITLSESSTSLDAVTISANANSAINSKRTGASTNINSEQIKALPSISRSIQDYTRLSPSSDGGNSFGGRNSQFNNFSLDGTIFNNPFGLDAPTVGGQSNAQPVSLDAIEQVQVATAPYDVTQAGFTGASVNAVTKSGTNELHGTVFGFGRNKALTGSDNNGNKQDLNQGQFGFSLGGPIIKNTLFFFANAEIERRSDLGSSFLAARSGLTGANVSRVLASDLELVSTTLKNKFGYESGAYENFLLNTDNQKGVFKLDWNVSDQHKVSFLYNFLDAHRDLPANPLAIGRRGPDFLTLQFANAGYRINNKLNSFIVEVKSQFGNKSSNKFQAGYSEFVDYRDPASTPFPTIRIAKDKQSYIVDGHEPFSIYNRLNQKVYQVNDNYTIYAKKNTITVGASFEKFGFENCFNLGAYPGVFAPDFDSVAQFVTYVNAGKLDADVAAAKKTFADNSVDPLTKWNWSYTNVGQIAAYVQDEIQVSKNFTVTVGIRADKPLYFNTPELIATKLANKDQTCCYHPDNVYYNENGVATKFDQTKLPESTPVISPRVGFNWDIKGDRSEQLRGGSGLFTGRFPFVWISNQVANPNFFFYCVTAPDFKFPQVWRTNLGYDKKLGDGWVFSGDLSFTKDINGVMVRNYGINVPKGTLNSSIDARPTYLDANKTKDLFGGTNDAYVFTNTSEGYSTNFSAQIQKATKDNAFFSLAYNYNRTLESSSLVAEISSDAYDRNPAYGNVNQAVAGFTPFGNQQRIIGSASKKYNYGDKNQWSTTISGIFEAAQGGTVTGILNGRYSYTYAGDINNDGSGNNDLIFIPTDAQVDQMNFAGNAAAQSAQKAGLKAFIAQDDYLSANRGSVAQKYAAVMPWYSRIDLRILQDYRFKVGEKVNSLQLSLDLLNVGNLISSSWGTRQSPTTTQPIGVSVDSKGIPTYTFDTTLKNTYTQDPGLISRWQAQLGLRYIF